MNDTIILQNDIDKLVSWSKTWQMQFNVTKCHTMRISRKKELVLIDYYINGHKLSPVKNHPYLGVMLSNDLRWNSHVENIVVKANKSLGFVRRNLYPCSERTKRFSLCNHCETKFGVCYCCVGSIQTRTD